MENKFFMTGLGLFGLLTLLLWSGLLPAFTFVLGTLAFIGLIVLTRSKVESKSLHVIYFTTAVIVLFALNIIPIIQALFPLGTGIIKERKQIVDIQIYETLHIPAGLAIADYSMACTKAELIATTELQKESNGLFTEEKIKKMLDSVSPSSGLFPYSDEEAKFKAKIVVLKTLRAQCSEFILQHTPKGPIAATRDYVKSLKIGIVGWIAILVFLDLAGIAIAYKQEKKWISKLTFAIVMTFAIWLIGNWISSTTFSLQEVIEKITLVIDIPNRNLSTDITIALILTAIIGAVASVATAVNALKEGILPAKSVAIFALSSFVLYQLIPK